MKSISERAYDQYCLDWMISSGYSLQDAFNVLREGYSEGCAEGDIDGGTGCDDDFDYMVEYFEEQGFNGSMFVCYDEFVNAEYGMADYMKQLLTEREYLEYLADPLRFGDDYDE